MNHPWTTQMAVGLWTTNGQGSALIFQSLFWFSATNENQIIGPRYQLLLEMGISRAFYIVDSLWKWCPFPMGG